MCRAFGHQWRPTTVDKIKDTDDNTTWFVQHVKCVCCETEKMIEINPYGEVAARRYRYAEGYQVKGSLAQDDKARMRRGLVDG